MFDGFICILIGKYCDILAISIDSFDEGNNIAIGRHQSKKVHTDIVKQVAKWCHKYGIIFKINTVVNTFNWQEIMVPHIQVCCVCTFIYLFFFCFFMFLLFFLACLFLCVSSLCPKTRNTHSNDCSHTHTHTHKYTF